MGLSNYLEDLHLADIYHDTAKKIYVALYTTDPAEDDSGTEVAGGATGYARVRVYSDKATAPFWTTQEDDGAGGRQVKNDSDFEFPEVASGQSYGTVSHWGTHDAPLVETAWAASTAYSLGDLRIPTTPNGFYYEVTTAGTSAASEPTWPTTEGDTVTDGTVVWTCRKDHLLDYGAFDAAQTFGAGSVPRIKAGQLKIQRR